MKKILYLSVMVLLFTTNCKNKELEKMKEDNQKLQSMSDRKDSTINELFSSFDTIENNLVQIESKQTMIAKSAMQKNELKQDIRKHIEEDIMAINSLMEKNKNSIVVLEKKLNASNLNIKKLKMMISDFEKQISDKDTAISMLKEDLKKLNFSVETLNATVSSLQQSNAEKEQTISQETEELNTAWYAMGTQRELKDNKVITKSGGFVGIGRNKQMKQDFNTDYFKKIDITKTTTIDINAKKAKLLSEHPSDSYKFEGENMKVDRLLITDPKEFWKVSKYLVIVVE